MSRRLKPTADGCAQAIAVEFAGDSQDVSGEAFIERVCHRGERVEVAVLLADGSGAAALLHRGDWEWLELRAGDIVGVRVLSA